jgi:hypothetical protein
MEFWILCLNLIKWVLEVLSPGVNQLECQVDRSLPTSAYLKNEWSYTSAPPVCFDGVERDSFMLTVMVWRGTALCLLSIPHTPDSVALVVAC